MIELKKVFLTIVVFVSVSSFEVVNATRHDDIASNSPLLIDSHRKASNEDVLSVDSQENDTLLEETKKVDRIRIKESKNNSDKQQPDNKYLVDKTTYYSYLRDANSGDPRAMYNLSAFLGECNIVPEKTDNNISQIEDSGLEEEFVDDILSRMDRCNYRHSLLDGQSSKELSDAWIAEAAEHGDVFAKLELEDTGIVNSDPAILQPLLIEALKASKNDSALLEKSLFHVLVYQSNYLEETSLQSDTSRRSINRDGWSILYCKYSKGCDLEKITELYLAGGYSNVEIDEGIAKANLFERAIINQEWDALELDIPEIN